MDDDQGQVLVPTSVIWGYVNTIHKKNVEECYHKHDVSSSHEEW